MNYENVEAITFDEFVKENNICFEALSVEQLNTLLQYKYELEDRQKNYGMNSYVTHRIVGYDSDGYITKGDANRTEVNSKRLD